MPDPKMGRNQRLLHRHFAVRRIGRVAVPLVALVAVVIFPAVPSIKWIGLILAVSAIGSGLPMLLAMGYGFLALRDSHDESGYGLLLLGYQFMWGRRYLLRIPIGLVALGAYLVFGLWPSQGMSPWSQLGIAVLVFGLALPSELRHQGLGLRHFMGG